MVTGGIYGTLMDGQSSMFRLQQAKKPWEREQRALDANGQLAQKAEHAQSTPGFSLTPDQERDRASALTAMEEAKRVGGPKAAAAQRLEQVERKIEELKLAMRYAHHDRQKLAQLAREAAILAREAGRAAKEYGTGVAAAAEMGLGGGAGLTSTTEITRTTTTTTLTLQQTEVSFTLRISSDGTSAAAGASGAAAATGAMGVPAGEAAALPMPDLPMPDLPMPDVGAAAAQGLEDGEEGFVQSTADGQAAAAGNLPPEIARLVDGVLSGLQRGGFANSGNGGSGTDRPHTLMQRMLAENDLKMSRYKEADGFGRRVEAVLAVARNVIGEAKAANMLEQSEERRKARRDSFKEYDKMVDAAQKSVDELRQAAFGSSIDGKDILAALSGSGEAESGAAAGSDMAGGGAAGGSGTDVIVDGSAGTTETPTALVDVRA